MKVHHLLSSRIKSEALASVFTKNYTLLGIKVIFDPYFRIKDRKLYKLWRKIDSMNERLKEFQERNCRRNGELCFFAEAQKVGTGKPCCTYPAKLIVDDQGICVRGRLYTICEKCSYKATCPCGVDCVFYAGCESRRGISKV